MQSTAQTDDDPPTVASILIVEDDVLLRMALADELRTAGFTVIEARDTDEALVILQTPNAIGLVIADVDLPGQLGGVGLDSWLRQESPHVKVILVSRYETTRGGSVGFAKPFNMRALVLSAKELLLGTSRKG